jgi:hypothetical protein
MFAGERHGAARCGRGAGGEVRCSPASPGAARCEITARAIRTSMLPRKRSSRFVPGGTRRDRGEKGLHYVVRSGFDERRAQDNATDNAFMTRDVGLPRSEGAWQCLDGEPTSERQRAAQRRSGSASTEDKLHGRVVVRRRVVEMARTLSAIRPSTDRGRGRSPASRSRACARSSTPGLAEPKDLPRRPRSTGTGCPEAVGSVIPVTVPAPLMEQSGRSRARTARRIRSVTTAETVPRTLVLRIDPMTPYSDPRGAEISP